MTTLARVSLALGLFVSPDFSHSFVCVTSMCITRGASFYLITLFFVSSLSL
jgi:hypothetical protein